MDLEKALETLARLPSLPLGEQPTPVEPMELLRQALGGGPRLLLKRDDAISFGFGGNKVRKLRLVAARALAEGADTRGRPGGSSHPTMLRSAFDAAFSSPCHFQSR